MYMIEKLDFDIWVQGEGQDTSRPSKGGFGSMYAMLPMWGLGAKIGAKNLNLNQRRYSFNFVTIRFVSKKQAICKWMSQSNEKWPSYAH